LSYRAGVPAGQAARVAGRRGHDPGRVRLGYRAVVLTRQTANVRRARHRASRETLQYRAACWEIARQAADVLRTRNRTVLEAKVLHDAARAQRREKAHIVLARPVDRKPGDDVPLTVKFARKRQ